MRAAKVKKQNNRSSKLYSKREIEEKLWKFIKEIKRYEILVKKAVCAQKSKPNTVM